VSIFPTVSVGSFSILVEDGGIGIGRYRCSDLDAEISKKARHARRGSEFVHTTGVRHGSMRQLAAVDVTATGGQIHGRDPQQRD
jgi:hypothetical protein